jgi:hypothetical protein
MAKSLGNLAVIQRRKMVSILLVYLVSAGVGCFILVSFPFTTGVIIALPVAFGLGWVFTVIVNKTVRLRCSVCDSGELKESFVLQCRLPEFQCECCQQRYVDSE